MVRRLSRKTLLSRVLTAVLVIAFTASFTGVGGATPLPSGSQESTATPLAEAPTPVESPRAEEAPAEAVASDPTAEEPVVAPDPVAAPEAAPNAPAAPAPALAPAVSGAAIAPSTITPAGTGVSMTFEGYRPSADDWTTGNIDPTGDYYYEDDFVPLRLVIQNKGDSTWTGSPVVLLDHLNSGTIGWDMTQEWHFNVTADAPSATGQYPPSTGAITVADTFPGGYGLAANMRCVLPALTIPAGQYGTVYFQAHLALTPYWNDVNGDDGSQAWPGASLHVTLEDGGAKTLPIPVPQTPTGVVNGLKFEDAAPLGSYEGENGLGGWEFTLTRINSAFVFTETATSSSDDPIGAFAFSGLPAGDYLIDEAPQTGWETEYDLPLTVTLARGGALDVDVGNYVPDVTKTFSLSLDDIADNVGLYATYLVAGGSWSSPLALSGTGPYTGSVEVPYGTHITGVRWYATYAGEDVLLYEETVDETLTEDFTNPGDYDSSICGHKFSDDDVDGVWDDGEDGLAGWNIHLIRETADGDVLYDETTTDPDGYYSFEDIIPGTYRVEEVLQGGYYQRVHPSSDIVIPAGGTTVEDLDFGNVFVFSDIEVTKDGPDVAHVGDTITYTIVVTNTGSTPLHDVEVVDPLFADQYPDGVIATIPELGATPVTIYVDYEITSADPDPLPNTVVATGYDLLDVPKTDDDSHEVDIIHPAVAVEKTVDFNGDGVFGDSETYYAGATATWKVVVTNAGDSDLYGVTVTDSNGHDFGDPFDLAAGSDPVEFTYTTTVDADTLNTATVEAYDELEEPVTPDSDDATAETISPAFTVSKLVDFNGDGVFTDSETNYAGETASWQITLTNTGDDDLMLDLSDSNGHDFGSGLVALPAEGQPVVIVYTTNPMVDTVDTVTATAYDSLGGDSTLTDSADVDVVYPGDLNIEKTVDFNGDGVFNDSETYYAGSPAVWKIVVSNEGAVQPSVFVPVGDLFGVMVTDTNGRSWGPFDLRSGESTTFVYTEDSVPDDKTNTASATATDGLENEVGPVSDDASVRAIAPSITVVKTSDAPAEGVFAGTTVIYTFHVTAGPEPLTNVVLDDAVLGFTHEIGDMEADASVDVTTSAVLSEPTTNTVVVTGLDELEGEVTDDDTLFIDVAAPFTVDMGIEKSADRKTADPGETVTYTLKYTNYGDAPISDFTVTDDFDERYVTVTDAAGGAVADGKIVWNVADLVLPGESGTIVYKVRIDEDMPSGETLVDNVVVITAAGDENPDNDRAEWRVTVAFLPFTPPKEPGLPFTGGDAALLLLGAGGAALLGAALRRKSRRAA